MNLLPVFTEKTREFCLYSGFAGILFAIISTVHVLMAAALINWFVLLLILPNLSAVISFIILANAGRHSFIFLNATLVLFVCYFLVVFYLLKNFVVIYSPSTLLLFVYSLSIVIYGYITDLPGKLRERYVRVKEEEAYWNNKI